MIHNAVCMLVDVCVCVCVPMYVCDCVFGPNKFILIWPRVRYIEHTPQRTMVSMITGNELGVQAFVIVKLLILWLH